MDATKAIRFLQTLAIPEGPLAGRRLKLAPFQKRFVQGAFDPAVDLAVLSVGRGNAKSAAWMADQCERIRAGDSRNHDHYETRMRP